MSLYRVGTVYPNDDIGWIRIVADLRKLHPDILSDREIIIFVKNKEIKDKFDQGQLKTSHTDSFRIKYRYSSDYMSKNPGLKDDEDYSPYNFIYRSDAINCRDELLRNEDYSKAWVMKLEVSTTEHWRRDDREGKPICNYGGCVDDAVWTAQVLNDNGFDERDYCDRCVERDGYNSVESKKRIGSENFVAAIDFGSKEPKVQIFPGPATEPVDEIITKRIERVFACFCGERSDAGYEGKVLLDKLPDGIYTCPRCGKQYCPPDGTHGDYVPDHLVLDSTLASRIKGRDK